MSRFRSGNGKGVKRTPGWDNKNPYREEAPTNTNTVSTGKTLDEILEMMNDKEKRKEELKKKFDYE